MARKKKQVKKSVIPQNEDELFLSETQKGEFLHHYWNGLSLAEIIETLGIDPRQFHRTIKQDMEFKKEIDRAFDFQAEILADKLIDAAHNMKDVKRATLLSNNIKWLLSKKKADIYGDRIDLNMNHSVDIAGALDEARQRLSGNTPRIAVDAKPQPIDIPSKTIEKVTDEKSVEKEGMSPEIDISKIFS